jgi:AcrR family transcriptional regulator
VASLHAAKAMHPTKALLLETAVNLIDRSGPHGFTVEELLETSGISKGSMYHHFEDFNDVIETAQITRYSRYVDEDNANIAQILSRVSSRDEMFAAFRAIVNASSGAERAASREDRAAIVGQVRHSPKFAAQLAAEQERLTGALTDIARELQERGFVKREVDPRLLATFVQAYSFGRVLDDIAPAKVKNDEWTDLILEALRSIT